MSTPPQLSIVVPVFDAASHLEDLTETLLDIPSVSVEVIFVDDSSSDDSAAILHRLSAKHSNVTALFHEKNLGAGVARNTGFARACGTYTLFFDADDRLHSEVVSHALAQLEATKADMAMFPYRYERELNASYAGMNLNDQSIWKTYVGTNDMVSGLLPEFSRLLGFTNYPWNKIIRTANFRACGLEYGSTNVNNDILGHWYSLLFAERILLINAVICTHIVHPTGSNLTNQHSRARLQLFDALNETYELLRAYPALRQRYAHHFWELALRTSNWARARIPLELVEDFNNALQALVSRIDLGDYSQMKLRRAPAIAQQMTKILLS